LPGPLGAFGKAAVLAGDHAEIAMGIGIARIGPQNLGITRRRLGQHAAPMQRQRFLQQIRGSGNRHVGGNQTNWWCAGKGSSILPRDSGAG
jgi:hypothetical protein